MAALSGRSPPISPATGDRRARAVPGAPRGGRGMRLAPRYRGGKVRPPSPTLSDFWASELLEALTPVRWRPAADTWETPTAVEIAVELAGVQEDALEVQLFE